MGTFGRMQEKLSRSYASIGCNNYIRCGMHRSCATECLNTTQDEHFKFYWIGYLKDKSTLMLYDRHPDLQSKRDKAFWARGYYVEIIGNVTEAAIKKYIEEQSDESRKGETVPLYSGPVTRLRLPAFWR